jgi:uncharacterized protein YcfJ
MVEEKFMNKRLYNLLDSLLAVALLMPLASANADIVAYPKRGQSEKQQTQDKSSCADWAKKNTGIDPEQLLRQSQQPGQTPQPQGGAVRGAAKGAAVGTVGGAIGGDVGKGAAVGAGVGAVGGASRRAKSEQQANQAAAQQQAEIQKKLDTYDKAQKACLEGKGYSVS